MMSLFLPQASEEQAQLFLHAEASQAGHRLVPVSPAAGEHVLLVQTSESGQR